MHGALLPELKIWWITVDNMHFDSKRRLAAGFWVYHEQLGSSA
jgi:hypothetical protein